MIYPAHPSNCLLMALAHVIIYGGRIGVRRSEHWRVLGIRMVHFVWCDHWGNVWDYRPLCACNRALPPWRFYGSIYRDGSLWSGPQPCADFIGC